MLERANNCKNLNLCFAVCRSLEKHATSRYRHLYATADLKDRRIRVNVPGCCAPVKDVKDFG
jgi:hypothetical protein